MCVEVGNLTEDKEGSTDPDEQGAMVLGGSRRIGAEDPVGDVETGESPVVGAVLKDVASGHGGIAESVHEEGLILALEEVQGQEEADEELHVGWLRERLFKVEVHEVTEGEEEESWNQEGAKVFDNEDGAPCDLGTYLIGKMTTIAVLVTSSAFSLIFGVSHRRFIRPRTEIFDMDHTRLLESSVPNGGSLGIRNYRSVTALGDAQSVHRSTRGFSNGVVQLFTRCGGCDIDL